MIQHPTHQTAQAVLQQTLLHMDPMQQAPLILETGAVPVSFTRATDPNWLTDQIHLRSDRWRTEDLRVLGTLWWYSASVWLQCPSLASIVATGRVLSPRLRDLSMHWLPDSRIVGATSTAVLEGEPVNALARELRESLGSIIESLGQLCRINQRSLWAIASDSLANRLLWASRAVGDVDRAVRLAGPLADVVGTPLPRPRYVAVSAAGRPANRPVLFTRRSSCCLLYEAPSQSKCTSCPKRAPADRQAGLHEAARYF